MSSESPQVPPEFICPITHTVMIDAVMDDEGNSYSRHAIMEWLQKSSTSPITRNPLAADKLVPNRTLRDLIANFLKAHNLKPEQVTTIKRADVNKSDLKVTLTRGEDNRVLVKIIPPSAESPLPLNLVCAIDVSASMNSPVSLKNETGDVEDLGLSVLDLVKHSIKTIILCLSSRDTISFVTYNQSAKVELHPLLLTDENKKKATGVLEKIIASGQTNLWDGLSRSLEMCEGAKNDQNNNIMLFTDGMPNVIPPRGHIPMLKKYIAEHKGVPAVINTFGFGYSMDSPLLSEIAELGGGTYAFIPDGSLVGTIFVNAVSTMMCRYARDVTLTIEENKERVVSAKGINRCYPVSRTPSGIKVSLGNICYGQPRHLIIKFDSLPDNFSNILKPEDVAFIDLSTLKKSSCLEVTVDDSLVYELESHELRLAMVSVIGRILELLNGNDRDGAELSVKRLIRIITGSSVASLDYMKDLLKDVTGQVQEAIEAKAYARWGRHFLPSLMQAHAHQICNNFKDPGVQHYGGKLFEKLRDIADDIFVKMPAPVGTCRTPSRVGYQSKGSAPANFSKPVSAKKFYNCSGGCIAGDSLVSTPSGMVKACDLSKGSVVVTPSGEAEILCVVKLQPEGGKIPFVKFPSGLRITPFHPILTPEGWKFPADCDNTVEIVSREEYVFDFVLSEGHVILANSLPVVTLGHGFTDDVVKHNFFGTSAVIDILQQHPGWEAGVVSLKPENFKRGSDSKICAIEF
eukprot:TRINITY_DN2770_c0_g1_i1.p1 TRINITY_DN2770_c0_g1~~TRINITY_DN2770_c0_g1_i1.p1  ORF type:complete len:765 (+),score=152.80 TRINITY_DN2770_c0_g1_i1:66-2297(+)